MLDAGPAAWGWKDQCWTLARIGELVRERFREGVWSSMKRSLANLTKQGIDQLVVLVKNRLKRMQYRPGLIDGFLAKTGLDLTLS